MKTLSFRQHYSSVAATEQMYALKCCRKVHICFQMVSQDPGAHGYVMQSAESHMRDGRETANIILILPMIQDVLMNVQKTLPTTRNAMLDVVHVSLHWAKKPLSTSHHHAIHF